MICRHIHLEFTFPFLAQNSFHRLFHLADSYLISRFQLVTSSGKTSLSQSLSLDTSSSPGFVCLTRPCQPACFPDHVTSHTVRRCGLNAILLSGLPLSKNKGFITVSPVPRGLAFCRWLHKYFCINKISNKEKKCCLPCFTVPMLSKPKTKEM